MNEMEVVKQVDQMVRFIKQEAEEKANEIMVSAEEEFNIEKLQMIEAEKQKIKKEYERKESQVEVKKKIEYSKKLNEMRLKVLTAKQESLDQIYSSAQKELQGASSKGNYGEMIKLLIVQAMHKLREPTVVLKCRKEDVSACEKQMEPARKLFAEKHKMEAPTITLDRKNFLLPGPKPGSDAVFCSGGVVITSADGKIACNNTLDHRLEIASKQCMPHVRAMLFGEAEKVRTERTMQTIHRE
uniref:V-type H+-transporting ATPase subunit E n=1 Tax=Tetraselmis sp. GSL018 TaxID=582737 RepID=A0A061S5Y1_9CHLO|mmetsp:Transcript_21920/g.52379  ORF Transcript_21920/g.52379 Transcript_21920/m.52379 type:complete len:242 (+) Transcript_21920:104-829(+)